MRIGIGLFGFSGFDEDCLHGIASYARPKRPWTFDKRHPTAEGVKLLLAQKPDGILAASSDKQALALLGSTSPKPFAKSPVRRRSNFAGWQRPEVG